MVPLIVVVVLEVLSRNSFGILQNAGFEDLARTLGLGPTLWVYDTSRMIAGVMFMAAAGYGLMRGVHIRADFLYRNWSAKTQATVDATLYLLFFMPSMIIFTIVASEFLVACLFNERNHADRQCLGTTFVARAPGDASRCLPLDVARHP